LNQILGKEEIIKRERLTGIQDESEQLKASLAQAVITAKKDKQNTTS
jgi:hypothetical protein